MSGTAHLGLPVLDIVFGTHIIGDLTLKLGTAVDGYPGLAVGKGDSHASQG